MKDGAIIYNLGIAKEDGSKKFCKLCRCQLSMRNKGDLCWGCHRLTFEDSHYKKESIGIAPEDTRCIIKGCPSTKRHKDMCGMHYQREYQKKYRKIKKGQK